MFAWTAIALAFVSAVCVGVAAIFAHKQRTTVDPDEPGLYKFHADEPGDINPVTVWTLAAATSAALSAAFSAVGQLVGS